MRSLAFALVALAACRDVVPLDAVEAARVEGALERDPVAHGRELFVHAWTRGDPLSHGGDGLGPSYNATSCVACHAQGGVGGAGGNHANAIVRDGDVLHRVGALPKNAGPRRVDLLGGLGIGARIGGFRGGSSASSGGLGVGTALPPLVTHVAVRVGTPVVVGVERELARRSLQRVQSQLRFCFEKALHTEAAQDGTVAIAWTVAADGAAEKISVSSSTIGSKSAEACMTRVVARTRLLSSSEGGARSVSAPITFAQSLGPQSVPLGLGRAAPSVTVERNTPALFGAGLIDAIPDEVIEAAAATAVALHPEISGELGRTADGFIARFGWKGDVPDLVTFVSRACAVELGLEVPGAPQPGPRPNGFDLDLDDLEDLIAYVRALPRPTEAHGQIVSEGAELFDSIGCTGCHMPALGDVDGLYSDLLLHDMGSELDDSANNGSYGAPPTSGSREWRTPPLWGVRDSAPYLHDGRARTLEAAIAKHGGEARVTRASFRALNDDGRAAVLAFLESLHAP